MRKYGAFFYYAEKIIFANPNKSRIFAVDFRRKSPKRYASTADVNVRNSNQCAVEYDGSRVLAWTAPISAH